MIQVLRNLSAMLLVTICLIARAIAEELPDDAKKAWNGVKGPAAAELFDWAKRQSLPCIDSKAERQCGLVPITYQVRNFPSSPGTKPERVLFQVYYQADTGNVVTYSAVLFEREKSGSYTFRREIINLAGPIERVAFRQSSVEIVTATHRPEDGRCCPSSKTKWVADFKSGNARYVSGNKLPGTVEKEQRELVQARQKTGQPVKLEGTWSDIDSSDVEIDFSKGELSLVDAGCKIKSRKASRKNVWNLKLECTSETVPKYKQNARLELVGRNLRLYFEGSTSFTELARRE
jgi:hypothetical protein